MTIVMMSSQTCYIESDDRLCQCVIVTVNK